MAYDGADHYVLEFGGDPDFGSTWTFANGTWTNVTLTVHGSPSPRAGGSMVFDPGRNETLLFGGYSFAGSGSTLADTWAYRAGTWTNLSGTVGAAPPARYFAGFAYDRNDSADVLFGGINNSSAPVDGTWELVDGAWSNVTGNQSSSPVSTQSPAFTSDVPDGDAVLFGSGTASAPFQNQTWTFSGNRWTNLTGNLTTAPPGVADAALSPDSAAGGVMLFGGYARPPGGVNLPAWLGETWVFSGGRWTDVGTGAPYPAERELEMMADDPADSGVVLYSGADYVAMTVFEDTWRFASGTWTQVGSPSMPTPRDGASMAYDSTTHQVILFGGSVLNDTWSYAGGTWSPLTTASTPPRRISAALVDDPGDGELVL
ncbi:MAG TPA: kelch repeat-containing protein, partial [Thermoplasmata archaeon]|nr:kelch repeat-containing protein [Thermoplasmata archaeon]